jgi:class 3 adenylate cyclase
VAERTTAFAFWGGVDLDLRGAEISGSIVEITAVAIMGSVEIVVPEGIPVELDGFVLMGGSDNRVRDATPIPGAPIIRVHAYGMWGGVIVRSKPPVETRDERRLAREQHRVDREQRHGPGRRPNLPPPPPPLPPFPGSPGAGAPPDRDIDDIVDSFERAPLDLRAQASSDGTVTILFTDIEGSAAWAERLGDQRWIDVLHDHNALVRGQIATYGGTEVKAQGDGFMIVFSSARRALLCAIGIQRALDHYRTEHHESAVQVRIGLHTGEVIHEAGDFFGKNVILAARIATHARGGEILASSLVKELTDGGELGFDEGDEVELKGLARPYRLHRVAWT